MKKALIIGFAVLGAITFMMQDAMAKPKQNQKLNAVSRLAHAGDIVGTLPACADFVVGRGIVVYAEGTSFAAYTDDQGKFTIYNVPAGTYNLFIEADGNPATVEGSAFDFEVVGKRQNPVTLECPAAPRKHRR